MARRRHLLAPLIVLALAGCGGDDSEDTKTVVITTTAGTSIAPPLTRAEYIAQADAICGQYNAKADEANEKISEVGDITSREQLGQVAEIIRQAVDEIRPGVQALQSLRPPTADRQALGNYLSTANAQLGILGSLADAYEEGDTANIRSLMAVVNENKAHQQGLAEGYGFKVCGQG